MSKHASTFVEAVETIPGLFPIVTIGGWLNIREAGKVEKQLHRSPRINPEFLHARDQSGSLDT